MDWEALTANEFPAAIKQSAGVCLLPLGVMEKHSDHLPVGTDLYAIRDICQKAAQTEPVVVFPPYYFTQIAEAKHTYGTVAIPPKLIWKLLDATCDEIGRNGFSKILIVNGHGGNNSFLPHFFIASLDRKRNYTLYMSATLKEFNRVSQEVFGVAEDEHAGRAETSLLMALRPKLVKKLPNHPGRKLDRLAHLKDISTAMFWYADYPEHYAGDPATAAPAKGRKLLQGVVKHLVETIRTVKADKTTPKLQQEYQQCMLGTEK